jgi:hypothetical protein
MFLGVLESVEEQHAVRLDVFTQVFAINGGVPKVEPIDRPPDAGDRRRPPVVFGSAGRAPGRRARSGGTGVVQRADEGITVIA